MADWDALRRSVGERLEKVEFPKLSPAEAQSLLHNPSYLRDTPAVLEKLAPGIVKVDHRPGAQPGDFWWPGDGIQASAMWHGYQSVWLPSALLKDDGLDRLTDAWFNASRLWSVSFHFNKGLAGGAPEAIAAVRDTAKLRWFRRMPRRGPDWRRRAPIAELRYEEL